MAQLGKSLAVKPVDLSSIPGTHKKSTDHHKLFSDFHMYTTKYV